MNLGPILVISLGLLLCRGSDLGARNGLVNTEEGQVQGPASLFANLWVSASNPMAVRDQVQLGVEGEVG